MAVAPGAGPVGGPVGAAELREADDAQQRLVVVGEGEGDPGQGQAADEVGGAVDGVEDPAEAVSGVAAFLLAEEPDSRGAVAQEAAGAALDGNVQIGDDVAVTLGGHLADGAGAQVTGGGADGLAGDVQEGGQVWSGHCRFSVCGAVPAATCAR